MGGHRPDGKIEPRLSPSMLRALWTEGNGGTEACVTRAVTASAVDLGARVVTAMVRGLRRSRRRATHVLLDSGPMPCEGVVIATGPWTGEPSRWLETPIPDRAGQGAAAPGPGPPGEVRLRLARCCPVRSRAGSRAPAGGHGESTPASIRPRHRRDVHRSWTAFLASFRYRGGARPEGDRGIASFDPRWPAGPRARGRMGECVPELGGGPKGHVVSAGMGKAAADLLATGSTGLSIGACSPERWATRPSA